MRANFLFCTLHTLHLLDSDRSPCSIEVIRMACAIWVNQPAYLQVLLETGVDVRILDPACVS